MNSKNILVNIKGDTLEERKVKIEESLDSFSNIDQVVKGLIDSGESFESNKFTKTLETMGTILIKSKDVESCRKVDDSFYETEKDYRSRYMIGKSSFATDFSLPENDIKEDLSKDNNNISTDYINKLCDLTSKTDKEVRNIITLGLKEKGVKGSFLAPHMQSMYEYMADIIKNEMKDSELNMAIFEMMIKGLTEGEIGKELGIPRTTIQYKIKKIINTLLYK